MLASSFLQIAYSHHRCRSKASLLVLRFLLSSLLSLAMPCHLKSACLYILNYHSCDVSIAALHQNSRLIEPTRIFPYVCVPASQRHKLCHHVFTGVLGMRPLTACLQAQRERWIILQWQSLSTVHFLQLAVKSYLFKVGNVYCSEMSFYNNIINIASKVKPFGF